MRDVLCWEPAHVGSIINIDADYVPDEVFWAVHLDSPLHVRGAAERSSFRIMQPKEILAEFLSPDRTHFQLAVLGQTGTGKSHLIHWMRQHIESDEHRAVVTVRRVETNLRAILDKLIGELPEEKRNTFRKELDGAGVMLKSREAQKETLLNNLSVAIRQDDVRGDSGLPRDAEDFFVKGLPNLLIDPQLRCDKFLKEGEIVDQLVDRLFSSRTGRREGDRLVFTADNLPLRNVHMAKASGIAQEIQGELLYNQAQTLPVALAIINRNLDDAISLSMTFSGDRLGELMGELRISLRNQGKELVLLFEELQRLQGYDGALLNALLVQGGDKLCNIRWAIACTTGFYEGLPDTARDRMTAIVDMDRSPLGELEASTHATRFASQYLNAVRWGRKALREAYGTAHERGNVSNKCASCEFQPTCHRVFGASDDGYGLYPFTPRAIEILWERASKGQSNEDSEGFNPRAFQKNVLNPMLEFGGAAIGAHCFPDGLLHSKFGGVSPAVPPIVRGQLQEKHGPKAERYIALLDLWSGSHDGDDLSPEIYGAFGLEPLAPSKEKPGTPNEASKVEIEAKPAEPSTKTRLAVRDTTPEIQQLRAWPAGGSLSQSLAQDLRELLFGVIIRSIDWDDLELEQAKFAGATGKARPFRQQSISFERQTTQKNPGVVTQLTLPFDATNETEFNRTAAALEGLFESKRHSGWTFPDAEEKLACLLELTDRCASEVVAQLRALEGDREDWDPLAGAMELLAVTAALRGGLPGDANAQKILDECFRPPPDRQTFHNGDLRSIYDRLRNSHADLVTFVRAQASGSKGGVVGAFLDPRRPYSAIRELVIRQWRLERLPKPLSVDFYYRVGDLYGSVSKSLGAAVDGEKAKRCEWITRVEEAFGADAKRDEIAMATEELAGIIHEAGLAVRSAGRLPILIERFKAAPFDKTRNEARALITADASSALATCGRGDVETAETADALVAALQRVFEEANSDLAARERTLGAAGGDRIETASVRIKKSLDDIMVNLEKLKRWADVAQ